MAFLSFLPIPIIPSHSFDSLSFLSFLCRSAAGERNGKGTTGTTEEMKFGCFSHIKDNDCEAQFTIIREMKGCIIIGKVNDQHNHEKSEELWKDCIQTRRLDSSETDHVKQLGKDFVSAIVRVMREETGKEVR